MRAVKCTYFPVCWWVRRSRDWRWVHVALEAAVGGTIALVEEGDSVTIDADKRLTEVEVRKARWGTAGRKGTRALPLYFRHALRMCPAGLKHQPSTITDG